MAPPSPSPSLSAAAARTERHTQPDTWATVASSYHTPQPTTFDDSCLDVRVSAFRHRNEEFPRAVGDQIYDLSTAVFVALRPIRQSKAPLRLARDLASSQRSPFRPETIDDVLTLCDPVRQAYNTSTARPWFHTNSRNLGRPRDGDPIPKRIRPATPRLAPTGNGKGRTPRADEERRNGP